MLVGCERNLFSEEGIGHAVIARIANDVQVFAADGFVDDALCVAVCEARAVGFKDKRSVVEFVAEVRFAEQCDESFVYKLSKFFSAGSGDDGDGRTGRLSVNR